MGQQICYIITPIEIEIPIDIVHFKEKNCKIIPLLIENYEFETMVFSTSDNQTVQEFLNTIIHLNYEYPTRKAFDFISKAELHTFGIIYYYDHFVASQDSKPILFINEKKVDIPWNNFEVEIHQQLESELKFHEIINDEVKYWSFYDAEKYYFEQLDRNFR